MRLCGKRFKIFIDLYLLPPLTEAGFFVEKMIEPLPAEELLEKYPEQRDLFHKPDFLIIRSRKF